MFIAPSPLALAVFVGPRGRGSNLQALYAATQNGKLTGSVALVVGSKPDAPALVWAADAGLPVLVLDPKTCSDDYGAMLLAALRDANANTIALAGYLRRLPSEIVAAFSSRIVNVHPSLLPAFGGKGMYGHHVHQAVLNYGAKVSGCTVHFVDEAYDTGPVILQRTVPVEEGDTPETLAARILPHEHAVFIEALQMLALGRLHITGRVVHIQRLT